MKAISRLLIMFSMMVSMTGFSNTTTDLSQNSEIEYTINLEVNDISIDVVSTDVLYVNYSIALDDDFKITSVSTQVDFFKPVVALFDDVGWQILERNSIDNYIEFFNYEINNKIPENKIYNRNPRDGLTRVSE